MDNLLSSKDSKLSLLQSQVVCGTILCVAENFRDWLVGIIRERDLTYEQLGNEIGVSHGAIGGWVRGKYLPDPTSLKRLAEVAGVDPIWLFRLVGYLPGETDAGSLTPEQRIWLSLLDDLDEFDREELLAMARVRAKWRGRQREQPATG